jgi:hypothetical protein
MRGRPDFKVLAAMARRGVDEARAGIIGDVVAIEQGDVERVAEGCEGVGTNYISQTDRAKIFYMPERNLRRSSNGLCEIFS